MRLKLSLQAAGRRLSTIDIDILHVYSDNVDFIIWVLISLSIDRSRLGQTARRVAAAGGGVYANRAGGRARLSG